MDAAKIRSILKDKIRARGTQKEAAKAAKMTPAALSRLLAGEREMTLASLDRVMRAGHIDLVELLQAYSGGAGDTISIPVISLRSVPPMLGNFENFAQLVGDMTQERIPVPLQQGPAIGIRLPADTLSLKAGEIAVVVPAKDMEPGKPVAVQIQGRTEIGVWQQRAGMVQIAINDQPFSPEECTVIGRVRGAWRDI